ncbi:NAD(P)-dependent oxidoreductase [Ferrimonas kyonanensis]|uniref:NAD(P)-dependent oxidoreductase n=1 Tax=Ferrimonas kyonanensis TaxID=364763 RepID=UPI0003FF7292|nr:NAD(P)-dependent oxidoreductase [Ferrimonas kyonanensis]
MMPLMFTDAMPVLIIGGGRAAAIKATSVLRYQQRVTLISTQFNDQCLGLPCERIDGDVYQMRPEEFAGYQLIYLAMPWPATSGRRRYIERLADTLKANGKLVCVSCKPQLGNVINPCSRRVGEHVLSLSCDYSDPRRTRSLTQKLTDSLQRLTQPLL